MPYSDAFGTTDELLPAYNRLNEPTFASLAAARRGDGFQHLGNAIGGSLFGGGARDLRAQQAFAQGATSTARLQDILLQARQRRDAEIGRQAAAADALKAGDANLANLYLQEKVTPQGLGTYQLDTQKFKNIGDLMAEARGAAPDMNQFNRELMVMHGQPVQLTKVEGQNVLNPYLTPDAQTVSPTDIGTAMIGTQKATQAAHYGQAAAENALAGLRSGPQADAYRALAGQRDAKASAPAFSKPSRLPASEMTTLLGTPDDHGKMHIDPQRLADFLDTKEEMRQAGDPTWNDDAAVFQAFKQKRVDAANAAMAAANTDQTAPAATPVATAPAAIPSAPVIPKTGEIRNGYRFKGGDPADKNSWEKV